MLTVLFSSVVFSAAAAGGSTTLPIPVIAWQELQKFEPPIGSGSFGDVYKGRFKGADVAIKELRMRTMPADLMRDFHAETQIMWSCQFPNVLRLLGICTEAGHCAMIFELMSQGSLNSLLRSQAAMSESRRWQIAMDIANGLDRLHKKGVLHRDLKSHNILLDKRGRAYISDFGLAKLRLATSTATTHAAPVGTMRWRAPELLLTARPPKPNPAMDMYSYGMILWELATGKIPFEEQPDDLAIMHAVKAGEREEIPTDCPPEWQAIIAECWKAPEHRPTAAQILERLKKANPIKPAKSVWLPEEEPHPSSIPAAGFVTFPAAMEDWKKVLSYYWHHAVPGYDVGRIDVIFNPSMNASFMSAMRLLQQRQGNPRYAPSWSQDGDAAQRAEIYKQLESLAEPYQDDDHPDVKMMPVWHGTKRDRLGSLLSAGYTPFCSTDHGYFGEGVYAAHEASYAEAYANGCSPIHLDDGVLILNWLMTYSSYPITSQDYNTATKNLVRSIEPGKYDSRFIPVVRPPDGSYDYVPVQPGHPHDFTEVMVLDRAQILPRYLVTLQRSLPAVMPSGKPSQIQLMFLALKEKMEKFEKLQRLKLQDELQIEHQAGGQRIALAQRVAKCIVEEWEARKNLQFMLRQEYAERSGSVMALFRSSIPRPVGPVVPAIARGHEEFYRRFINGQLIYKKGEPDQVVLPFAALANPLGGTFDLSRCGDTGQYLSISTGYRKAKNPANASKVEIWIAPRFLIEQELRTTAAHFSGIMASWAGATAPLGLFWAWGGDSLRDFAYLTASSVEQIGTVDLYKNYLKSEIGSAGR